MSTEDMLFLQSSLLGNNPFAVLTAIVAPAILTNAQLTALRSRAQMLLGALRLFYAALGCFAASALVSVAGSIAAFYGKKLFFEITAALALLTGASAVVGLAIGCTLMVNETRLAVQSLAAEAEIRIRPARPTG